MKFQTPTTFFLILVSVLGSLAVYFWLLRSPAQSREKARHRMVFHHRPFEFSTPDDHLESQFRLDWPPREPAKSKKLKTPPLLRGQLVVSSGRQEKFSGINLRIQLTRASMPDDRERWNRALAFPEYDWMSRVRVWDVENKWLWPNLPFLLRAFGVDRHQRYGGVDPGAGVDNDFAAVVVKPLNSDGGESVLISADWFPLLEGPVDKHSVVHEAISEDLQWPLPPLPLMNGKLGVWLIYADFIRAVPPNSWPEEKEYDGGVLSYHSLAWRRTSDGAIEIVGIDNEVPPTGTGVDWQTWFDANRSDDFSHYQVDAQR